MNRLEVSSDLLAYVGCVAGAILIDEYKRGLLEAGFAQVEIVDTKRDLNVYDQIDIGDAAGSSELPVANASCCAPSIDSVKPNRVSDLLSRYSINDFAASVRVYALKPPITPD